MIYYKDDGTYPYDYETRQQATVEDATDFVRIAEVEFRKYRLVDKKIATDPNRRF